MSAAARARAALRFAARLLLLGALPGALLYGGLFAHSLWGGAGFDYMGVADESLTTGVAKLFERDILAQQKGLLVAYLSIGAALGALAFLGLELLAALRRRRRGWFLPALSTLLAVTAAHALLLVNSMGTYPAVYAPRCAGNGSPEGILFWLAVDVLPTWLPEALLGLVLAAAAVGVAVVSVRPLRAIRWRARVAVPAVVLAAVVVGTVIALVASAIRGSLPSSGTARRPNVVVVAVDSLRGDLVGTGADATPSLDAIAEKGLRFSSAYSVVPRTFPAWVTMLTGQYPHNHGVRHMFPAASVRAAPGASLVREARVAGYRTAVVSDFAGDIFTRMDFGFERVDAPPFTLASNVALGGLKVHLHLLPWLIDVAKCRATPELGAFERLVEPRWLTERALDWIAEGDGRPFFLVVFHSGGHFPYASPAPFWQRFVDDAYRGRSRFHLANVGEAPQGAEKEAEEQHVRALYRGALAASDDAIGALVAALDAAGLMENTVVLVTADHGENMWEAERGIGHGDHLYGLAGLHVPLVLAGGPVTRLGVSGGDVLDGTVRSVDIAPTLRRLMGVTPVAPEDGVDLLARREAGEGDRDLPVFAETGLWFLPPATERLAGRRLVYADGWDAFRYDPDTWDIELAPEFEDGAVVAKHRMLLQGTHKLLYVPTRGQVRWELFDTAADPDELVELSTREPARFRALKDELMGWILDDPTMHRVGDWALRGGAPR